MKSETWPFCNTVKPTTKNRDFKNLWGWHLPVKSPLYKNLFSLKFEPFLFSKIYENILYT